MNSLCNITDERECINIIFFYVLHAAIDMRKYFQFPSFFFLRMHINVIVIIVHLMEDLGRGLKANIQLQDASNCLTLT